MRSFAERQADAAEDRFYRYRAELRDHLVAADREADGGAWSAAANTITAAASAVAAMIGSARELALLHLITGRRERKPDA